MEYIDSRDNECNDEITMRIRATHAPVSVTTTKGEFVAIPTQIYESMIETIARCDKELQNAVLLAFGDNACDWDDTTVTVSAVADCLEIEEDLVIAVQTVFESEVFQCVGGGGFTPCGWELYQTIKLEEVINELRDDIKRQDQILLDIGKRMDPGGNESTSLDDQCDICEIDELRACIELNRELFTESTDEDWADFSPKGWMKYVKLQREKESKKPKNINSDGVKVYYAKYFGDGDKKVSDYQPLLSFFGAQGARVRTNTFNAPDLILDCSAQDKAIVSNLCKIIKSGREQGFEKLRIIIDSAFPKHYLKIVETVMALERVIIEVNDESYDLILHVSYPDLIWLESSYWNGKSRTQWNDKCMSGEELELVKNTFVTEKYTDEQHAAILKSLDIDL